MKKLFFTVAVAAAGLCFAETSKPEGTTFPVFTAGPDYYADGTLVNDGETYALVWVADGAEFGGFNTDGTLVDTDSNKLLSTAFKSKGHRLQYTPFQDTKGFIPEGGTIMLICLDTRTPEGGKGNLINSWSMVKAESAKNSIGGLLKALKGVESVTDYLSAKLPKNIAQPTIKKIEVRGNEVWVTVERTSKNVYYGVAGAKNPGKDSKFNLSKDGSAAQGDENSDIVLKYPVSANGQFFKVIGGTRSDVIGK